MGEMKTPSSRQVGEGRVSDAAVVAEHSRLKSSRRDVPLPPNRGVGMGTALLGVPKVTGREMARKESLDVNRGQLKLCKKGEVWAGK